MNYTFHCSTCDTDINIDLSIKDRNAEIYCNECRTPLKRKLTPPNLHGMYLGSSSLKKDKKDG